MQSNLACLISLLAVFTVSLCGPGLVGPAPTSVRWTCLMLDLQYTLSVYLNRSYSHLKSIKLCSNMLLKNMFTSDLLLDPGESQLTGFNHLIMSCG